MVAELSPPRTFPSSCCSLAKISMVAELFTFLIAFRFRCSLAKISMVAEQFSLQFKFANCCSLAKISMVAEPQNI